MTQDLPKSEAKTIVPWWWATVLVINPSVRWQQTFWLHFGALGGNGDLPSIFTVINGLHTGDFTLLSSVGQWLNLRACTAPLASVQTAIFSYICSG